MPPEGLRAWWIAWRGRTWSSVELDGRHAAVVGELLGVPPTWDFFDLDEVRPDGGPLQVMTLIAAFICVDEQVVGRAARVRILDALKDCSMSELREAVLWEPLPTTSAA